MAGTLDVPLGVPLGEDMDVVVGTRESVFSFVLLSGCSERIRMEGCLEG